MSEQNEFNNAS